MVLDTGGNQVVLDCQENEVNQSINEGEQTKKNKLKEAIKIGFQNNKIKGTIFLTFCAYQGVKHF